MGQHDLRYSGFQTVTRAHTLPEPGLISIRYSGDVAAAFRETLGPAAGTPHQTNWNADHGANQIGLSILRRVRSSSACWLD